MWEFWFRLVVLTIVAAWQPIQFLIFTYRIVLKNDKKMYEIAYAYDVLASVVMNGQRGETISSRTGRAYIENKRWGRVMKPLIDSFFGKGHCVTEAVKFLATRKLPKTT